MKIIISLVFFIQFYYGISQTNKSPKISQVSKNKDTLWLINDEMGRLIAKSWEIDNLAYEKKPVILLVDELPILMYDERKKRNKEK